MRSRCADECDRGPVSRRRTALRSPRSIVTAVLLIALLGASAQSIAGSRSSGTSSRPSPTNLFQVTVEAAGTTDAVGRPAHTVYRPQHLETVPFDMPVVMWANGGCRRGNQEFHYFLTQLASFGYFVVANGDPNHPFTAAELHTLLQPDPAKLISGLDWALAVNADPQSPYFKRLDGSRVVMMGQSCGGREAGAASADARVTTSILWNAQYCGPVEVGPAKTTDIPPRDECIARLHAPTLWVSGGPGDTTYADVQGDYERSRVPSVWADNPSVGHTLLWEDDSTAAPVTCCAGGPVHIGGGYSPSKYQNEPLILSWRWLDFVLYDDLSSRAFFLGQGCGLCERPGWSAKSKNWPSAR